jgi:hypothetical protein
VVEEAETFAVETDMVLLRASEAEALEAEETPVVMTMENVVGLDIGTIEVSSLPCFFVVVPVSEDVKDIVAIGYAVREPVREPDMAVAANDQVAVSTVVPAPVPIPGPLLPLPVPCSARTVAAEAMMMAAENFILK